VGRAQPRPCDEETHAAEIEQAIINADRMLKHPRDSDRGRIESVTDGGKRVVVIVQLVRDGVRPITGWEA
jgi:hypothetical protein